MLDHARAALPADRVELIVARLEDPLPDGPFDLVVSAIAIHNLRDMNAIAECYRGIARVLKPGGLFLDYDLFFDHTGGLSRHTELLKEAGFAEVECLWQQAPLATIAARTRP